MSETAVLSPPPACAESVPAEDADATSEPCDQLLAETAVAKLDTEPKVEEVPSPPDPVKTPQEETPSADAPEKRRPEAPSEGAEAKAKKAKTTVVTFDEDKDEVVIICDSDDTEVDS